MFNIALINYEKNDNLEYVNNLKEKHYKLHYFERNELASNVDILDAIIIKESSLEEFGENCDLIMKIRTLTDCYIWIFSEISTRINRIVYLQVGSDGTFNSQIDPDEFGIYIETTLKRRNTNIKFVKNIEKVQKKNIELIPSNFSVNIENRGEVSLTKLEFRLMEILVRHDGEAVSYDELLQSIWDGEKEKPKYCITNLIFHLRKKIGNPKYIQTVRSRGYRISISN